MTKTCLGRRAMALVLALLCLVGMLPAVSLAADSVPDSITLAKADYYSEGTLTQYNAPGGLGTVTMHVFRMDVDGKQVTGFCGDHTKDMGARFTGDSWIDPIEVSSNVYPLLAFYYWNCEHNPDFGGGETGNINLYVNSYIQCCIWLEKAGRLPDYRTDRQGWIDTVAEQRDKALEVYGITSTEGWTSKMDAEGQLIMYEAGNYGTNWTFREYFYYAGKEGDPQPVIVGIPTETPTEDKYKIRKVDTAGNNVSGVTFQVESTDGSFSTTVTTDSNGIAEFESTVGSGWYTITETDVPEGYVKNTAPVRVQLAANTTGEVRLANTKVEPPPGELKIRKVDGDDPTHGLAGAVIRLTHPQSGVTSTFTSGADGWCVIPQEFLDEMRTGIWLAEEITPPTGYRLNPDTGITKQEFVWDGETPVSLVFTNDSNVSIRFRKVDAETGKGLAGALIAVYKDGKPVTAQETDSSGYLVLNGVTEGFYVFEELTPPAGYAKGAVPYAGVHIDPAHLEGNKTVEVQLPNQKAPTLRVRKLDARTGDPIPNTRFEVVGVNSGYKTDVTTDASGWAVLTALESGAYEVTELAVPAPYLLDVNNHKTVSLTGGEDKTLVFQNSKEPGLRIVKTDAATGEAVPGVTFKIEKIDGTYANELTTDAKGEIFLENLEPGAYRVQEIAVPANYILNGEIKTVTLEPNKTATLEFQNAQRPGLRIVKKDEITGSPVANVTFHVEQVGGMYQNDLTTDAKGEIFMENLEPGPYQVTETAVPGNYILSGETKTVTLEPNKTATLEFQNAQRPGLKIIKTDAGTGAGVPGVTFKIEKIDGTYANDLTTDAKGEIFLENLEPGAYRVQEIAVPANYILSGEIKTVTLEPNKTATLEFQNAQRPGLKIKKVDAEGTPIAGVKFSVKVKNGSEIGTFTTDAAGEIYLENLDATWYTITEKFAPEGYILDSTPHDVLLEAGASGDGKAYQVYNAVNYAKPKLTIHKVDSMVGGPVAGAKFQIVYAGENKSGTRKDLGARYSDAHGEISLENLDPGWYRVKEVEAPAGYQIKQPDTQEIYLGGGDVKSVTFENPPLSAIALVKRDSVTGQPVEGCTFRLRYLGGTSGSGGTVVDERTTSANGTIVWTGRQAGTYIIEEIAAGTGYVMTETAKTVYLSGNQQDVVTVEFTNDPLGSLLIKKVCTLEPDKTLKGAQFKVTYADGSLIGTANGYFETDANGEILITGLEPGKSVVVTETRAPEGFVIDNTPQTIETVAGKTVSLTFANAPKGKIIIEKRDSVTNQLLPGAEFRVTTAAGCEVGQNGVIGEATLTSGGLFRTNAEGRITLTSLKPGNYVIHEVTAPAGYLIDEPSRTITVTAGDTQTIVFKDTAMQSLTVQKFVEGTTTPIQGVTFLITDSSGEVLGTNNGEFTTDQNGRIVLTGLTPGTTITAKEIRVPEGYVLDSTPQSIKIKQGEAQTLTFYNRKMGTLVIKKLDSETKQPLSGAEFKLTYDNGRFVDDDYGHISSNGVYKTDKNGEIRIVGLTGTIVAEEIKAPDGYLLDPDNARQTVKVNPDDTQTLTFYNTSIGGLTIYKVDEATGKRLEGAKIEARRMNGEIIGTYVTDQHGAIRLYDLDDGWYTLTELKAPKGYLLDSTPQQVEVKQGQRTVFEFENTKAASMLIHKIDAITGADLAGAKFMVYDASMTPIGEYESDSDGEVHLNKTLHDGKYFVREIVAPPGYVLDNTVKSFQVLAGDTAVIEWKNTPNLAQIQISKTSADYNTVNGLPAGTALPDAVYTIYDKNMSVVDTVKTNASGIANSKLLPWGRYYVKEAAAPANYGLDPETYPVELEFAGQIVQLKLTDASLKTGVSISKTGPALVMNGQNMMRYLVTGVSNDSTVPLSSFYWRDTLPVDAFRLQTIVTGTYSSTQTYKITYTTNYSGEWRTAYDNLNTSQNYTLDMSASALGLQSGECVTQVMLSFGIVPAGFHQLTEATIYGSVLYELPDGYQFSNKADVGGLCGEYWVQGIARWTTTVKSTYVPPKLPRTGY